MFNYEIFEKIEKEGSFSIIPELLNIAKKDRIGAWNHDNKFVLDLGSPQAILQFEEYTKNKI